MKGEGCRGESEGGVCEGGGVKGCSHFHSCGSPFSSTLLCRGSLV